MDTEPHRHRTQARPLARLRRLLPEIALITVMLLLAIGLRAVAALH